MAFNNQNNSIIILCALFPPCIETLHVVNKKKPLRHLKASLKISQIKPVELERNNEVQAGDEPADPQPNDNNNDMLKHCNGRSTTTKGTHGVAIVYMVLTRSAYVSYACFLLLRKHIAMSFGQ